MPPISLVAEAHKFIDKTLQSGDIAIDATCGNGHDTLFLAEQVGINGQVYGFDVQQRALDLTAIKLQEQQQFKQVELTLAGHERMQAFIPKQHQQDISAIMFNLGYLPSGDKSIITLAETTLTALNAASQLLKPSGLMTVIVYPGHDGGQQELQALQNWVIHLDSTCFQHTLLTLDEKDSTKPRLFTIKKHS